MAVADPDHDPDHFSSVSWTEQTDGGHPTGEASRASQAGHMDFDPHGLGRERLECQVGSPLKENDGSKDAFISYLITTHVSRSIPCRAYFTRREKIVVGHTRKKHERKEKK